MRLFRVVKAAYAHDLQGTGARQVGGRWNSRGIAVLYASGDAVTAMREVLASGIPMALLRGSHVLVEIEVEGRRGFRTPTAEELPPEWEQDPFGIPTQAFGDALIEAGMFLFRVPSIREKGGWNHVLNPGHTDYEDRVRVVRVTAISDLPDLPPTSNERGSSL